MKPLRRHVALITAGLVSITTGADAVTVHPEATLKSPRTSVAAGTAIPLNGEKFQENQTVRLVLRGALAEYPLLAVTADGAGEFALALDIPRDVRPGRYRIDAIADDGDAVAKLDLTVEAAAPVREDGMPAAGETGHADMEMKARADELPIERSRSGMEWGVIGVLIGLAAGLGIGLVRKVS